MFYAINAKGTVIFRSQVLATIKSHVALVHICSGVALDIVTKVPKVKVRYASVLQYNDPIECIEG